jgi:hypothetical protein
VFVQIKASEFARIALLSLISVLVLFRDSGILSAFMGEAAHIRRSRSMQSE